MKKKSTIAEQFQKDLDAAVKRCGGIPYKISDPTGPIANVRVAMYAACVRAKPSGSGRSLVTFTDGSSLEIANEGLPNAGKQRG